jgi:hypothetical protein
MIATATLHATTLLHFGIVHAMLDTVEMEHTAWTSMNAE